MTMLEVVISATIFALVMAFVVYATFFVGKSVNVINAESRADASVRNAAELIRHHLSMAKKATFTVGNPNTSISWRNPEFGADSSLTFNAGNGTLALTNPNGFNRTIEGLTNVRFTTTHLNTMVEVLVESQGNALGGDKIIPVSQSMKIRPRN